MTDNDNPTPISSTLLSTVYYFMKQPLLRYTAY